MREMREHEARLQALPPVETPEDAKVPPKAEPVPLQPTNRVKIDTDVKIARAIFICGGE